MISSMYDPTFATSHAPARTDMETREITMGALVREVAGAHPDARALGKISLQGPDGWRSNYAGVLVMPIQSEPGYEI